MTWQLYITAAVLLLSVAILLQRVILHSYKADDVAFAGTFQLVVAAVMLPWVLLHGASFHGLLAAWFPVALSTLGFGVGSVVYAKALRHIDASAFMVLFATQAVWIMLAGTALYHEKLGPAQIAGALFILISVGLLARNRAVFHGRQGVLLGLLTGLIFGISIAASAYVARNTEPITWTWLSFLLAGIASLLVSPRKIPLCKNLIRGTILRTMLLLGIVSAIGTVAMTYAYIYGPFSLVAPIRQTGILVTTLLAFAFLRDERTHVARKLVAAAVCTIGVVLLVI